MRISPVEENELTTKDLFRYSPSHNYTASSPIVNVLPADFNQDGRLDVLLMFGGEKNGWWGGASDTLGMDVILGAEGGTFGMLRIPQPRLPLLIM